MPDLSTRDPWFEPTVSRSFDDAPEEWKRGEISESFFNMTGQPACYHVKIGREEYFTTIKIGGLYTREDCYSASLGYWNLTNTGSTSRRWTKVGTRRCSCLDYSEPISPTHPRIKQ